jgi:DNA-binding SARP family transcriptional activator
MTVGIRLLGTVRFELEDGRCAEADVVPTVKALDLLRLLADAGDSWRSADHYISVLWPAAGTDEHGRASLRTAVAQLRRALGPDVVRRSGDLIGLGDATTDIARLRRLASRLEDAGAEGDQRAVLTLAREAEDTCGGDLVLSGSSCDSVYALRDELRGLRHRMLLDAARAAARLGDMRTSLDLARSADSLHSTEASVRAVMTALAGAGETAEAVEAFERLRSRLSDVYGVQPSPATRALYLQVVTAGEACALDPVTCHPDKAFEVATAVARLHDASRQDGVVWLQGEPGSGRDSVAREARRMADELPAARRTAFALLPEVVELDTTEGERLRAEARERNCVLVVPVRRLVKPLSSREHVVRVGRLDRDAFDELLVQLLQERPTPELSARVWSASGGLAGQACRTVEHLVRQGALVWTPTGMGLAFGERPAPRRGARLHPAARVKALCLPVLLDLTSRLAALEPTLASMPTV